MTSLRNTTVVAVMLVVLTLACAGCAGGHDSESCPPGTDANGKAEDKPGEAARNGGIELWARVLAGRVDENGLVDYKGLKEDKEDFRNLHAYLDYLKTVGPGQLKTREEKLAFWINCYNAAVIAGVLRYYPIESIKDVKDFWHEVKVRVGEKQYSLGEIENKVLRGLGEPRMHWAIVRASKGSAALLAEPYSAEALEDQLAKQEKDYLVGRRQVYINREKKTLKLSSFFYWYGEDFIKAAGTKLDYVKKYLSEGDLDFLEDNPVSNKYIKYDWSLNKQEK
jgi:hypothetical protein